MNDKTSENLSVYLVPNRSCQCEKNRLGIFVKYTLLLKVINQQVMVGGREEKETNYTGDIGMILLGSKLFSDSLP